MAGVPPHLLRNGEAIVLNLRELSRHCERQIHARNNGYGASANNRTGDGDSGTLANHDGPVVNDSGSSLDHALLPDLPLPKELFVPAAPVVPTPGTFGTSSASPRRGQPTGASSLGEWEIVDG
mmetsp:Transcript_60708/g.166715  ORF Transcript_60708/g.166715 Transcript_60708/m.166715 type:complete len:123 (+) Transcript_60708:280-648(+)